jgi:hypothetical protein
MKGTKKKTEGLNLENILKRISEYDIYRYYLGRDFRINDTLKSPFPDRKDDTPSFIIGNKTGYLYHFDFGDPRYRGNCINFVQQITGATSYYDGLLRVDLDFSLGIISQPLDPARYKQIVGQFTKPDNIDELKKPSIIQVKAKPFDQSELNYWAQYYINKEDLKQEKVYSVKEVYLNKKRLPIGPTEFVFGYLYGDKWKIYRPYATNKKLKWLTNVPIDEIDGIKDIKNCDKVLITKAKKDKMVIKKIFPCVCSVQAETIVGINEDDLTYLRSNSIEQYINFDSDSPGKKNSWLYTETFGFKHINVPDQYLTEQPPIKDFADFAKKYGLKALEDYFKLKGLI